MATKIQKEESGQSRRPLVRQSVAARYLDVSEAKLERDRWAGGNIPYVKIGGAVRYDLDQLDAYRDRQTVGEVTAQ